MLVWCLFCRELSSVLWEVGKKVKYSIFLLDFLVFRRGKNRIKKVYGYKKIEIYIYLIVCMCGVCGGVCVCLRNFRERVVFE